MVKRSWQELTNWDEVSFYLARVTRSAFLLPREHIPEAHLRTMQFHAEWKRKYDTLFPKLAKYRTLEEHFLETRFVQTYFDVEGNIIGFKQGWDMWIMDLLEVIPDLIRPKSYFLLRDDCKKYWKVVFDGERMKTYQRV